MDVDGARAGVGVELGWLGRPGRPGERPPARGRPLPPPPPPPPSQILALFAMEPPVSLDAEDIRNEKVKVLRCMRPVALDDVVVGQYAARTTPDGTTLPGYLDDATVPPGSLCPTFAAAAVFINNPRWDGVPFLLKAGKALQARSAEIRVQFRHVPGNLYRDKLGVDLDRATNELVIRIQPDEAIYLKVNNKAREDGGGGGGGGWKGGGVLDAGVALKISLDEFGRLGEGQANLFR